MLPGATCVELGLLKFRTLCHMEGILLPWIHPYFDGLKDFLKDYAAALFPNTNTKFDLQVMSNTDPKVLLHIVCKHKSKIQELSLSDKNYQCKLGRLKKKQKVQ